jgi:hypothetical protein
MKCEVHLLSLQKGQRGDWVVVGEEVKDLKWNEEE